ncbi:MAG: hypothetical protein H7X97_07065 [Opitutaceae bacterium]|nr:hypothetical protein [Verrucomicrobiales bacterium]
MLLNRQLPAFNGVPATLASGAITTVTCKLNLGERIHVAWIQFGNDGATNPGQGIGTLKAPGMVQEIRVIIDGKVQRRFTAQELNAINSLMNEPGSTEYTAKTSGTAASAGYRTMIPIFFAERWRRGAVTVTGNNGPVAVPEAELSAWNLTGIETATIEVDLIGRTSAGANAVLDGPVITGFYEYDALVQRNIGQIVKYKRFSFGPTSNPAEYTSLDRKTGSYQSLHLFPTSADQYVTTLMFTRDNVQVRQDITRFQNDAILLSNKMNPTALDTASSTTKQNTGLYNVVFDYDDQIRNLLGVSGVNELTLKPTYDSAPSGTQIIIAQITGDLD